MWILNISDIIQLNVKHNSEIHPSVIQLNLNLIQI